MPLGDFLNGLLRSRPSLRHSGDLAGFMAAQAAFVAQKAVMDHIHAVVGLDLTRLSREPGFDEALTRCRAEAFAAVLEEVSETVDIYLRRRMENPPPPAELASLACLALAREQRIASRIEPGAVAAAVEMRISRARLAPPRQVRMLGETSVTRLQPLLPVRRDMGPLEREILLNSVRFLLCRVHADLEAQADHAALTASLANRSPTPN
jgi:hypothetical protein